MGRCLVALVFILRMLIELMVETMINARYYQIILIALEKSSFQNLINTVIS